MLEEKNTNEDVEPHAQIDGGDVLNFLYNLLPHPSFQVEKMGGVFFFLTIPSLILLLNPTFMVVFIDDILVYNNFMEEHVEHL
jgi:hypothetical protein